MSGSFRPWTRPPVLTVGEIVRLIEGGPLYRVSRVTPTSATLKPRTSVPSLVEIKAKGTRSARSFYVYEQGQPIFVSTHAFVIRVPKED
jgi:hypothetical protein